MNWYCLSSFDAVASATLLRREGFVAYCPQAKVTRWKGRKQSAKRVDATVALWSGYLFVSCEPDQLGAALVLGDATDFLRYTNAHGVRGPLRLRDGVLTDIVVNELFGGLDFRDKTPEAYKPNKGDRVRIKAGMWADHFARITAVNKDGKSKLDLEKGGKMTAKVEILEAA
jgi:transcription antitermination factor NusG